MNRNEVIEQLFDISGKLTEMEIALDICEQSHTTMIEGVNQAIELIESGRVFQAIELLQIISYGATEEDMEESE